MQKLTARQQQAIKTKLKITETAMQMLQNNSYEEVKVSDICKKADISVGNFYHYFKSKDLLIKETYNSVDSTILQNYLEKEYNSYMEAIINLNRCASMEMNKLGYKFLRNAYRQLLVDEEEYTISPERKFNTELLKLVQKAIDNNEFQKVSAYFLSEYIAKTARGVIFDWCIKHGSFDITEVWTNDITNIIKMYA